MRQPEAWPTRVALPRWLLKVLAWSAGLALLAAVIMEAWRLGLGGGLEFEGVSLAAAAAAGAAFGFAAATLDELAHSRHASDPGYVHGKRSSRRPVLFAVAGIVLVLAALLTPRVIATAGEPERGAGARRRPARNWAEARWNELDDVDGQADPQPDAQYDEKEPRGRRASPTPGRLIKLPERQKLDHWQCAGGRNV